MQNLGRGMSIWSYTRSWSAEPEAIARARAFARDSLARHRGDIAAYDVMLVVSELATNAVTHAGTPFSVTLTSLDDSVLVSVRDGVDSLPPHPVAGPDATNGRGLWIVEAFSSDWGVTPEPEGGKSVWAAFGPATLAVPD